MFFTTSIVAKCWAYPGQMHHSHDLCLTKDSLLWLWMWKHVSMALQWVNAPSSEETSTRGHLIFQTRNQPRLLHPPQSWCLTVQAASLLNLKTAASTIGWCLTYNLPDLWLPLPSWQPFYGGIHYPILHIPQVPCSLNKVGHSWATVWLRLGSTSHAANGKLWANHHLSA